MTRIPGIGGPAVHVEAGPQGPLRFRRDLRGGRRRTYVVTEVLARWVESGPWWLYRPPGEDQGPDPVGERQVWRVEASRDGVTGVYDLAHDGRRWRLVRTLD